MQYKIPVNKGPGNRSASVSAFRVTALRCADAEIAVGTTKPTISQFYGITIRMYFDDHPPPYFHAYYGRDAAKIDIDTLDVAEG